MTTLNPYPSLTSADPKELEKIRALLTRAAASLEKIEDSLAATIGKFGDLAEQISDLPEAPSGEEFGRVASLVGDHLEILEVMISEDEGSIPWVGAELSVLAQFLWPTEEERQQARLDEVNRISRKGFGGSDG